MGTTRDTGYLRNLVIYDGSGNITLPANLTVTGTITGYATTSYVTTQINNLINGAPGLLDTLDELAAALGDDANFAATLTTSLSGKQSTLTFTGPLVNTSGTVAITQSSGSTNGFLSNTDWTTFNSKQSTLTFSGPLVNTSGTISITQSSGSTNGYLSNTDWSTFNNKQAALSGTGFVKISGTTISYDNSTYLTTASATSTYLPLAGGTLTGALSGTSATFSSDVAISGSSGALYSLGQLGFTNTGAGGQYGIYTLGTATPTMYFDHRATGNTGQWIWRSGTGGATTALILSNAGAATFSSSVTAGQGTFAVSSGDNLILEKPTGAYLSFKNGATIRGSINGNNGTDGLNLNYGASHTTALAISSTGAATFSSSVQADFLVVGTTAATSGGLRLGTQVAIRARNVANTANIPLIESTASDGVSVSNGALTLASTGAATFSSTLRSQGDFYGANGTSTLASIRFNDANTGFYHPTGTDNLGIITSGTQKAIILANGNVGINVVAPTEKLQVNGSFRFGDSTNYLTSSRDGTGVYMELAGTSTATRQLRIQGINDAGTSYSSIRLEAGLSQILFVTADTTRLTIASTGAATFINGASKLFEIASNTATGGYTRFTYNTSTSIGYIGSSNQLSGLGLVSDLELRADNNLFLTTTGGSLKLASTGTATFTTTENQGGVYVTSATDNTTIRVGSTATGGQEWRLQSTGGTSGLGQGKLIFKVGGTETVSHIPLTLTTDNSSNGGRVGIGTVTPVAALNVSNIPTSYYGIIETTGTSAGTVKHFRVHKPGYVEYGIGILDNNSFHISTASTFPTTNGFTLTSGGNVTIGGKLTVTSGYYLYGGNYNTSYTSDGLWGGSATPNKVQGVTGGNFLLGYSDNGSGLYCPAYGFEVRQTDGLGNNITIDAIIMRNTETGARPFIVTNKGSLTLAGSLSKGSGSFKINHPLQSKKNKNYLVHSFLEGPKADLLYRGKINLVNGLAVINIDTTAGMTEGTFEVLCRDVQCFTTNESGWDLVKGTIIGNILTITSQNSDSNDLISWLVIGERQDEHMYETEWTDENGHVILEPEIPEGVIL